MPVPSKKFVFHLVVDATACGDNITRGYYSKKNTTSVSIKFVLFLFVRDHLNGMNTYVAKHMLFLSLRICFIPE